MRISTWPVTNSLLSHALILYTAVILANTRADYNLEQVILMQHFKDAPFPLAGVQTLTFNSKSKKKISLANADTLIGTLV